MNLVRGRPSRSDNNPNNSWGRALHDSKIIQIIHGSAAGFAHFFWSSGPTPEALRLQFQLILSLPLLSYRSPNCCQPWLGLRSRSSCKAKRRHPATPSCLATASQRRLSSRHNRNSANHSSSNDRSSRASIF
jgi:hypothetical protein